MQERTRPPGASYDIRVTGVKRTPMRDLYHRFLRVSWPVAIVAIVVWYLLANLLFALVYRFAGGVQNLPPASLLWSFFFSVQTMGTIGYGAMYPVTELANGVVVVESVIGMLLTALFTGLVFAKFSQPNGKIVFSNHAVVTRHDGKLTLMFRIGNERGNRVVEATARVDAVVRTTTAEGRTFYRAHELVLARPRMGALSRAWNVMHVLEDKSPIANLTEAMADERELELSVTVTGLDDTTGQTVHGYRLYEASALRFGMRLKDGLSVDPDGTFVFDARRFHDIEPDGNAL
jgi:inward rectifier potassium channel